MLTNRELDLLLEVSDYLTSEESKGYLVLLSNFELDAQAKKFCEMLQEARGRGTPPPSASDYFFDFIWEVGANEFLFQIYKRQGGMSEPLNTHIFSCQQCKALRKQGKILLEEYEHIKKIYDKQAKAGLI